MKAKLQSLTLAYTDQGHGLPVVLLHAFPLNRQMWQPQIDVCSREYRILALDLRGHGESIAPEGPYTMDEMATDVRVLLDHLRIDQVVLVGLSMGGYISLAFFRQYRERVRALVLADTRAQADGEAGRSARYQMIELANRQGGEPIADTMLERLLSPAGRQNGTLVEQIRALILSTPVSTITRDLVAMADRPDSSSLLPEIQCPTLVMVGEHDQPSPPDEARRLAEVIGHSQFALIANAGHLSNLEEPDAFNEALLSFLERLR